MVVLSFISLASCGSGGAGGEGDHDHAEARLAFTAYSESYEAFAEAGPLVAKESSELLVHLTRLENFAPLSADADVSAGLFVGREEVWQTARSGGRPGIFRFVLRPGKAGTGKLIIRINASGSSHDIELSRVTVFKDHHEASHEEHRPEALPAGAVFFSKEQSWKVDFATGYAGSRGFGPVIRTAAVVGSAPGDEAIIHARAAGIVMFTVNEISEGIEVKSGQELMLISGEGMAENDLSVRFFKAGKDLAQKESEYLRIRELARDRIVSEKSLIEARSLFENARAVFLALQKNFSSRGQRISSPMDGYVRDLLVRNGDYVEAGAALLAIARNQAFILKAGIPSRYRSLLNDRIAVNLRLPDSGSVYALEKLGGRLLASGKSVDPASSLIPVSFMIGSAPELVPGMTVELFVRPESARSALLVPVGALIEEQGKFFVWRQLTPESFEKLEVKTGFSDGLFTEIVSGLEETVRIVTRGAIYIKLAAVSSVLDPHSGHTH